MGIQTKGTHDGSMVQRENRQISPRTHASWRIWPFPRYQIEGLSEEDHRQFLLSRQWHGRRQEELDSQDHAQHPSRPKQEEGCTYREHNTTSRSRRLKKAVGLCHGIHRYTPPTTPTLTPPPAGTTTLTLHIFLSQLHQFSSHHLKNMWMEQ